MASNSASMSTLGSFYDALYELAEKQVQKGGEAAAPDLVPGQMTDAVAAGIIDVAGSMTGSTSLQPILMGKGGLNEQIMAALGKNVGGNIQIVTKPPLGSATYTIDGEVISSQDVKGIEIAVNAGSVSSAMGNPMKFANDLADSYWQNLQKARQADMVASLFGDPIKEVAAINISNRMNGVDPDIAASITVAHAERINNEAKTGIAITDSNDAKVLESKKNLMGALDTAIAMTAGIDDVNGREEFAKFYNDKVKKEVVDDYNNSVKGTTYAEVKDFDDLFVDAKRGQKISSLKDSELFDASTNMGVGDLVQGAYTNVLTKYAMDPSLSPSLKSNLLSFHNTVQNQAKLGDITRSVSLGVDKTTADARPLLKIGLQELKDKNAGADTKKNRAYAAAAVSLQKDVIANAGARAVSRDVAYMVHRWQTMPTLSKVFSPAGVLTGASWKEFSSWSGGLRGASIGNANVASLIGVNSLKAVSGKSDKFKNKIGALDAKINSTSDPAKKAKFDLEKKRYEGKLKQREAYLGDKNNAFSGMLKSTRDWKKVDVISHKATGIQKTAYRLYAFAPGAFFGGLLNGDTFQRLAWIGTGYGKNLKDPDKWTLMGKFSHRMLNNKGYQATVGLARGFGAVINFPANITTAAIKTMQYATRTAIDNAKKWLAKKLLSEAASAALAYISAGVSKVLEVGYFILNTISFGMLDKISQELLRFTMQIILGVIVGIIAFTAMGIQSYAGGVGGPAYIAQNAGNGGLLPPDPNYSPLVSTGDSAQPPEPTGPPTNPVDIISLPGAKGVDVSHWEGTIDWPTAKSSGNVEFALIKASEGTGFVDDQFSRNWKNSKSAGVKRTAYHFFLGDINGKAQAQHFLNVVKSAGDGEDFQLAVDVEWPYKRATASTSVASRNLHEMVDFIEVARGYKPIIYTSYYAWSDIVGNPNWVGDDYPLWVANYISNPQNVKNGGPSKLPVGWTKWLIWQYTDAGKIAGIPGAVDLDVWNDAK